MIGSVLHFTGLALILAVPIVACFSLLGIPRVSRGERGKMAIVGPAALAVAQLIVGGGLVLLGIPFEFGTSSDVALFIPGVVVTAIGCAATALAVQMIRGAT